MATKVFVRGLLLALVPSLIGWVAPLRAQDASFTELQDLVPDRCFSAALSTVAADSVDIGIESGFSSTSWTNKACIASTRPFNTRSVTDTFTVTATPLRRGGGLPASTTSRQAPVFSSGVPTGRPAASAR